MRVSAPVLGAAGAPSGCRRIGPRGHRRCGRTALGWTRTPPSPRSALVRIGCCDATSVAGSAQHTIGSRGGSASASSCDLPAQQCLQLRDEPPDALALTSLTLVIWTVENFFLPGSRGIWVAFLSRLPFTASQQLQAFPPLLRPVQVRNSSFDDPATPSDEALSAEMTRDDPRWPRAHHVAGWHSADANQCPLQNIVDAGRAQPARLALHPVRPDRRTLRQLPPGATAAELQLSWGGGARAIPP